MQMQLYNLEKWRDQMDETMDAIREEMDAIPSILEDYTAEIAALEQEYGQVVSDLADSETDWLASATEFRDHLVDLSESFARSGIDFSVPTLEELLEGVFTMPAGFEAVGDPFMSWLREFNAARQEYEAIQAALLPSLGGIPHEIDLINIAIDEQVAFFEELAQQLEEAGNTVGAAYAAQLAALTSSFLGGLEEIIRSHTLSDYEQQLYALDEWYKEQIEVAEALGTGLNLVNYAYELQYKALQDLNDESEDFTGTLEDWKSVLESIDDQILKIKISKASPATALERMALLQQEISGYGSPTSPSDVQKLQDLWGEYLNIAQEVHQRPSTEYQNIYYSVLDALEGLKGVAEERISEYEIQAQQLAIQEQQLEALDKIATFVDYENPFHLHDVPSYQHGTDYVPETGIYKLHQGEQVIPANSTSFSLVVQVNESKTPHATGMAVRKEFETFVKSSIGRKLIQQESRGR